MAAGNRLRFRLLIPLAAAMLSPAAFSAPSFTEKDLRAPGAADSVLSALGEAASAAEAVALLERAAPLSADGPGRASLFSALARLRELTGSFSLAADAWLSAASAVEATTAAEASLEAVRCLIAVNDNARAAEIASTVAAAAPTPEFAERARLLGAYASAFNRDPSAERLLHSLLEDQAQSANRPTLLFILSSLYGDRAAAERLAAEFPSTLEARIVSDETVSLAAAPYWLLAAERSAVAVSALDGEKAAASEEAPAARSGPVSLQVGLFRSERNAKELAARLAGKGFAAGVESRAVEAASYWAVTVDPGKDPDGMTMRLKDAGFESFPLF